MSDDRSVQTDALKVLGRTITDKDNVGRDAIHLAVMPVVAGERIAPGAEIGFRKDREYGTAYEMGGGLGIADPFLTQHVQVGETFLLVVHPRTITSLRHVWEHPDFDPKQYTNPAKERMEGFCKENNLDGLELLAAAEGFLTNGESLNVGDNEGLEVYHGFWRDWEAVTGKEAIRMATSYQAAGRADENGDESFFSCSC